MTAYVAAAAFYIRVRTFAQSQPDWAERITYETKPDEVWDMTLAAERVYGDRDEFLTIMAAAGLDGIEHPMQPQRLVLPTLAQLEAIKLATGYSVNPEDRTAREARDPLTTR